MLVLLLLAGLVTGLLMSMPMGPMAALAALKLGAGAKRDAVLIAAGVCVADALLAVAAVVLLYVPFPYQEAPDWLPVTVGSGVLLLMAAWLWKDGTKDVQPVKGLIGFWGAVLVGLFHPGNVLGYVALFTSVLPSLSFGSLRDLTLVQQVALVMGTMGGVVLGWAVFLMVMEATLKRYGMLPTRWRPRVAKVVSLAMVFSALMMLGMHFL